MIKKDDSVFNWLVKLCGVLIVKSICIVLIILYSGIGLGPDEAQYWTWSQQLDWGYYSKPPGIAWQIWLGTQLFGNTELGVRFPSIILGFLLSLSVFALARTCGLKARTAFWAGVMMALCPLGVLGSLFAITDGGLVLFWTLACIVVAAALREQKEPNYTLLGLVILLGAIYKWPIYLFWVVVLALWPFYKYLISWKFVGGIMISLLGLLPSVIWNVQHEWATFRHVGATVSGGHAPSQSLFHGNLFEFIGSQAGLISPILFVLLIMAFWHLVRNRHTIAAPLLFCGASSLIILAAFCVMAIFQKVQGNWSDFAYPSGIVFLAWYAFEGPHPKVNWIKTGVALSVICCGLAFKIPYVQSHNVLPQWPIPYKFNLFHHNIGWQQLEKELSQYQPDFLFADKYQMSSILSFYNPEQQRAYFLNLQGSRKNQFSFWPEMTGEVGKRGLYVLVENAPHLGKWSETKIEELQKLLQEYFTEVRFLGNKSLFKAYGVSVKEAFFFECINYNGKQPPESHLF